ncbi:hypothetical protein FisN_1Hh608 [Fistulifera solaris]|uniref:peptidylprolyl isomerase n=1 Tax=Fistulifera solaris TaxID=1519565 RepID=A0A1Z5KRI1_FISSO|nr:hypothetical protein FisN_1Hh608 [Fistulifera solaris]|eukprot:GAX28601.1 hypothetical protein FisN_1Hh608 [Fistulifera solaris]
MNSQHKYCYLDFDLDDTRNKLGQAAAFCHATNQRYGFSSPDLRQLGGSELKRIHDYLENDHEWKGKSIALLPVKSNRIVLLLKWDVAPLACENFLALCCNDEKQIGQSGKPLTYRNSTVHRVIPKFVVQGGDFVFGNGSGGESIFNGKKFKDERPGLLLKHDRRGILSMGNSGKNSNSSQFFITFDKAPQCDGKHVVFGEVVSGWDVLDALESTGMPNTETPQVSIRITDCGAWTPLQTPGAGYWYDQPDEESYSGISPVFMVRPRVAVLAPNDHVADKFKVALEPVCTVVTFTAIDIINAWLQSYAIDLLVVAPACETEAHQITLPSDWEITREQVILVSKPMDALQNIRFNSWLVSRNWPLDGAI